MSALQALAIVGAGLVAGTINTIVGSGSLVTFPTLLAFGYPAVLANVSNNVGLVPGTISSVVAYRAELGGQARRVAVLGTAAALGSVTGASLLLVLPHSVFRRVVPALILVACVLVAVQPALSRRLADRPRRQHGGAVLVGSVFSCGIYGGYFGAAQGVILLALLGTFLAEDLQRLNGAKNALALVVNGVAAVVFVVATHVDWAIVLALGIGASVGGQVGGVVGRRLAPAVLRLVIIAVGVTAAIALLV